MNPARRRAGRLHRRIVDIDAIDEFDAVAAASASASPSMDGWRVRGVDLTERGPVLATFDPAGSLFLGCQLTPDALARLQSGGALVYPDVPDVPVDEYRSSLYTPDELYGGLHEQGYRATPDALIYAWSRRRTAVAAVAAVAADVADVADVVVRALHDAAIEAALDADLERRDRPIVGVMGGHGVERGSDGYRRAVMLGRSLAGLEFCVATGGGPGAMEAANLGAYLTTSPMSDVDSAIAMVAAVPSFLPSIGDWATAAMDVRRAWPGGDGGIGVPTWFYGHEPPNVFATGIAKFFQNSVREATLLNRCNGGVVFLPGAAGTVQEVFQDACENYYASADLVAPMVMVGVHHWTQTVPAWPLLDALAGARGFRHAIALVDDVDGAATFLDSARRARHDR